MSTWRDAIKQGYTIDHPSGSFVIGDPQGPYDMLIAQSGHDEESHGTLDVAKVDQYLNEAGINDHRWFVDLNFAPGTPVEELEGRVLPSRNTRRFIVMEYLLNRQTSRVANVRVAGLDDDDCDRKMQVYLNLKKLDLRDEPMSPIREFHCSVSGENYN